MNFQIYFTSSIGQTPEKIGTDVGRSLYKPPMKISPIGVKAPFYWLLKSILQNRNIKTNIFTHGIVKLYNTQFVQFTQMIFNACNIYIYISCRFRHVTMLFSNRNDKQTDSNKHQQSEKLALQP